MTDPIDVRELRRLLEAATEIRPVPGYSGYYADSDGNIWSTESDWRGYGPRKLSTTVTRDGYLRVRPVVGGRRVNLAAHRAVALAFHGEPLPSQEVRHLDGSRQNNRPHNLRWGSRSENARDRKVHGTEMAAVNGAVSRAKISGAKNRQAKLTDAAVLEIRAGSLSIRAAAKKYGVCDQTICHAKKGRSWAHLKTEK